MFAVLLDDVQRFIRITEKLTEVSSFVRDTDGTDRGSQRDVHVFAHEFLGGLNDLSIEVFSDLFDICFIQGVFHKSDEFISAETAAHVAFAYRGQNEFRKPDQDAVAHVMTVDVVDEFETVEVDHHEHTGLFFTDLGQDLLRCRFVIKSGHRIGRHFFLKTADLDGSSVDRDKQPDDVTGEHNDNKEYV